MEAQTVEQAINNYEDLDSWNTVMFLYNAALQEVSTKLNILNEEFQHIHRYNPIEHIGTRIKSPESIVKKLKKNGHESSIENMIRYVNDIAGVRLICSFTSDIYKLAKMIASHKIYYKFEGNAPAYISKQLRECAKMVSSLDERMLQLNDAIQECIRQQEEKEERERQERRVKRLADEQQKQS